MRILNEYVKGGNKGSIAENIREGYTTYIAVTSTSSKTFKSLKGAERFMTKLEYKIVI